MVDLSTAPSATVYDYAVAPAVIRRPDGHRRIAKRLLLLVPMPGRHARPAPPAAPPARPAAAAAGFPRRRAPPAGWRQRSASCRPWAAPASRPWRRSARPCRRAAGAAPVPPRPRPPARPGSPARPATGCWRRRCRMLAADRPDLVGTVVLLGCSGKVQPSAEIAEAIRLAQAPDTPGDVRAHAVQQAWFAPGRDIAIWMDGWSQPVMKAYLAAAARDRHGQVVDGGTGAGADPARRARRQRAAGERASVESGDRRPGRTDGAARHRPRQSAWRPPTPSPTPSWPAWQREVRHDRRPEGQGLPRHGIEPRHRRRRRPRASASAACASPSITAPDRPRRSRSVRPSSPAAARRSCSKATVAQPGVVERLIDEATAAFSRLDILVNNAADLLERRVVADTDDALFDRHMALNVRPVFAACRAAVQLFRAQGGGGGIINLSSIAARTGGGGGSALYAGSKAFVATFSRALAKEVAAGRHPGKLRRTRRAGHADAGPHHAARNAGGDPQPDPAAADRGGGGERRRLPLAQLGQAQRLRDRPDHRGERRPVDALTAPGELKAAPACWVGPNGLPLGPG